MTGLPTVLALDSSHPKGSVAVSRGGEIACEIIFDASDTHSATLMPAVDGCLRTARTVLHDIDLFAVVTGPGSFTGLRIGLATVKAFAAVEGKPVVTAGSLELMAGAIPFASLPVLPLIDARRGEVYAALYSTAGGDPVELVRPASVKPLLAGKILEGAGVNGPVVMCGTGSMHYREELQRAMPVGSLFASPVWSVPSAGLLAVLAPGRERVEYVDLAGIEPLYIRGPDARVPSGAKLKRGG